MRLPKLDLRLRIAIALATVCIAVVGALGVTLHAASEKMEWALVDQLVKEELDFLVDRASRADGYVPAGGPNLEYYVASASAQHDKTPQELRDLPPGQHEVVTHAGPETRGRARSRRHALHGELRHRPARAAGSAVSPARLSRARHSRRARDRARLLGLRDAHPAVDRARERAWRFSSRTNRIRSSSSLTTTAKSPRSRGRSTLYHGRLVDVLRREQEFTANASHELRTPLTAIQTTCEVIQTEPALPDKTRTRITMIESATRQMTERIEALLLLARQRKPEEIERVDLRRCVEEAAHAYHDEIARKGLALEIAIEDGTIVELDRKALQLVLANLIKNAVRYTDRGRIRISYDAPRVIVADSGIGIAPEHAAAVVRALLPRRQHARRARSRPRDRPPHLRRLRLEGRSAEPSWRRLDFYGRAGVGGVDRDT